MTPLELRLNDPAKSVVVRCNVLFICKRKEHFASRIFDAVMELD